VKCPDCDSELNTEGVCDKCEGGRVCEACGLSLDLCECPPPDGITIKLVRLQ
jgi:hypothetical protein